MKHMIIQLRILKDSGLSKLKELLGLKNGTEYGIGTLKKPILAGLRVLNLMHVIIALTDMLKMDMGTKLLLFGKEMIPLKVKN